MLDPDQKSGSAKQKVPVAQDCLVVCAAVDSERIQDRGEEGAGTGQEAPGCLSQARNTRRKRTFLPKFVNLRPENNSSLTYDIDFSCETAFWSRNPQISTGSLLVTGDQSFLNSARTV
jgi:hypothetical protein